MQLINFFFFKDELERDFMSCEKSNHESKTYLGTVLLPELA